MKYHGLLASKLSGSLAGVTASHNKGGQYFRARVVPVTSTTSAALAAKARLQSISSAWSGLTEAQRLSWNEFGRVRPATNTLGDAITLSGQQWYVALNTRILQAAGTVTTAPPTTQDPEPLATLTGTFDIGMGDFQIVYTRTPLAATEQLWCQAAVAPSPGVNNVANLLRVVSIQAAATASPIDLQTAIETYFGALVVGVKVVIQASVFESTNGLLSRALRVDGIVSTT